MQPSDTSGDIMAGKDEIVKESHWNASTHRGSSKVIKLPNADTRINSASIKRPISIAQRFKGDYSFSSVRRSLNHQTTTQLMTNTTVTASPPSGPKGPPVITSGPTSIKLNKVPPDTAPPLTSKPKTLPWAQFQTAWMLKTPHKPPS